MRRQTSIRVEDRFYKESEKIFNELGLSFGDAVNLFLAKVALEKRIPFEIGIPSKELAKRIRNIENDKDTEIYETAEELFKELGI
jgi:DNA-damage-inducible protein J